jgi:hypothetical protein
MVCASACAFVLYSLLYSFEGEVQQQDCFFCDFEVQNRSDACALFLLRPVDPHRIAFVITAPCLLNTGNTALSC